MCEVRVSTFDARRLEGFQREPEELDAVSLVTSDGDDRRGPPDAEVRAAVHVTRGRYGRDGLLSHRPVAVTVTHATIDDPVRNRHPRVESPRPHRRRRR